jgi:DNA-binding MarR family transcriptional regulator
VKYSAVMAREQPRWLTEDEQQAWIVFTGVLVKLPYALDADMRSSAGFSHFEYLVLSGISETPDRTLPMSELATLANASLSRLSHVVSRLEDRGWVFRSPSAEDGRITMVSLTKEGFAVLAEAAPGHVETVRDLVVDVLSPAQIRQLTAISKKILARLDPGGEWPPLTTRS